MVPVKSPEIQAALKSCIRHFTFAAAYSLIANVLLFAFPLFMLNIYSRVLTSRSLETLTVLFVGFVIAIAFKSIFEFLRSSLLVRAALRLDRRLTERILECLFERRTAGRVDIGQQALRDLDGFRHFVTGVGGSALIDVPWGALFLAALFVLNVKMAAAALAAIVVITALTALDAFLIRADVAKADRQAVSSYGFVEANLPTAEAVLGMGYLPGVLAKWRGVREPGLAFQTKASYRAHGFDGAITAIRYVAQAVFIAVGVTEVLAGSVSSGLLIASMFIFQFAMTPFDKIIHAWSGFAAVKEGLLRLERVLETSPARESRMGLPRPDGEIAFRGVSFVPPGMGSERAVLRNVSFGVKGGETLGVVGLIGSGKTTLARLMVGALKPTAGSVRLGGNEVWSWIRADGGRYVGYVPQSVGLQTATVADNIGRFGMFDETAVIVAAKMAGAHDLIQRLPQGYDTLIGDGGHPISGGQRQLIALARAVIDVPPLVVLDEPNSNLDGPGEDALTRCIAQMKELGSTVVLISHRPNLVRGLDKLLLLRDGQVVAFGEAEEVWRQLGRPVVVRRGIADANATATAEPQPARVSNGTA